MATTKHRELQCLKHFRLKYVRTKCDNMVSFYKSSHNWIKTHDSELRGQEEAGRTRRMSVLFTGSTGVKFVNALNKPP